MHLIFRELVALLGEGRLGLPCFAGVWPGFLRPLFRGTVHLRSLLCYSFHGEAHYRWYMNLSNRACSISTKSDSSAPAPAPAPAPRKAPGRRPRRSRPRPRPPKSARPPPATIPPPPPPPPPPRPALPTRAAAGRTEAAAPSKAAVAAAHGLCIRPTKGRTTGHSEQAIRAALSLPPPPHSTALQMAWKSWPSGQGSLAAERGKRARIGRSRGPAAAPVPPAQAGLAWPGSGRDAARPRRL